MKHAVIAIDPGSSTGAVAAYRPYGGKMFVANLPKEPREIYEMLQGLHAAYPFARMFIENVGGTRPGNAAKAARTFATHIGHLEMACVVLCFECSKVAPQTWMKRWSNQPDWPRNPKSPRGVARSSPEVLEYRKACATAKAARKKYIYNAMLARYPEIKFTERQADAVGIMHYALGLEAGS